MPRFPRPHFAFVQRFFPMTNALAIMALGAFKRSKTACKAVVGDAFVAARNGAERIVRVPMAASPPNALSCRSVQPGPFPAWMVGQPTKIWVEDAYS